MQRAVGDGSGSESVEAYKQRYDIRVSGRGDRLRSREGDTGRRVSQTGTTKRGRDGDGIPKPSATVVELSLPIRPHARV